MADVTLIAVPYHLGREGVGMALGPDAYIAGGLADRLAEAGHDVRSVRVTHPGAFAGELAAVAELNGELAGVVETALASGSLPLVAGGNCNVALGMTAGLQASGSGAVGVVWFDAHGDFNTPATTPGGFLDGMPLAILTGRCHQEVWARLGRGRAAPTGPVPEDLVVHAGGRDIDPGERLAFERSPLAVVPCDVLLARGPSALDEPLARSAGRAAAVYLHVDIDVLDPAVAPGVDFPAPGGLTLAALEAALERVAERVPVRAVSVTAYDPQRDDPRETTLAAGSALIERVVDLMTAR